MVLTLTCVVTCAVLASPAGADGTHHHPAASPMGRPGIAADVTRVVEIAMVEPEAGGMGFEPGALSFAPGETVRLTVTNTGVLQHEIVLGTVAENAAHAQAMAGGSPMMHHDANALSLAPGETGSLIWTFGEAGVFQFACLIPGHLEAGMQGPLIVGN